MTGITRRQLIATGAAATAMGMGGLSTATAQSTVDFSGKTLVPFCSFGSGGLDSSIKDLEEKQPQAKVLPGYGVRAARIDAVPQEVDRFLKENGIRTHAMLKLSQGSDEILNSIRQGHVAYIINTREIGEAESESDGLKIRRCATENNATIFTSLDTVRVLLDVLEETTLTISTIDA